jgi:hypothetical protein
MRKFPAGLRFWFNVQGGRQKVHAVCDPDRIPMGAEEGSGAILSFQQSLHGQRHRLRLVSAGQPPRGRFDQRDDVRTIDGDDMGHERIRSSMTPLKIFNAVRLRNRDHP